MRFFSDGLGQAVELTPEFVATHLTICSSDPGYGAPGATVTLLRGLNMAGEERYFILEAKELPCTLGVGCEDFGVCCALAHDQPEMCGKS